MMRVEPTVEQVRAFATGHGLKPATMARKAGLHANTLRGLFDADWNPRADTLQKLANAINDGAIATPAATSVNPAEKASVPSRARTRRAA